jgi:hypothetical protein
MEQAYVQLSSEDRCEIASGYGHCLAVASTRAHIVGAC